MQVLLGPSPGYPVEVYAFDHAIVKDFAVLSKSKRVIFLCEFLRRFNPNTKQTLL